MTTAAHIRRAFAWGFLYGSSFGAALAIATFVYSAATT